MKMIYKYQLPGTANGVVAEFLMPAHAEIVHAGLDPNHYPCLWAIVEVSNTETVRRFCIAGTGREIPKNTIYIKSWVDGPFTWHLFELI